MIDIDELSRMFRSEAHDRLHELIAVLKPEGPNVRDNSRFDDGRRAAHNLKGAALTVGAQPIAVLCRILEAEFQVQSQSNGPPSDDQIATWLYMVSEMQGLVDDPNIISIQLTGFSEPASAPEDASGQERTSGCVSGADLGKTPEETDAFDGLSAREFVTQLEQVARIQQRLTDRVQSLQAHFAECAFPDANTEAPGSQLMIEVRADLAGIHKELQQLGLVVREFAPMPK